MDNYNNNAKEKMFQEALINEKDFLMKVMQDFCQKKYPDETKMIVKEGHELGNHSYSQQQLIFKSQSFIQNEIEKTNQLIRSAGYEGKITFRPPNGKKLFRLPRYLSQHDIETIM